jgi:hypothetical protein
MDSNSGHPSGYVNDYNLTGTKNVTISLAQIWGGGTVGPTAINGTAVGKTLFMDPATAKKLIAAQLPGYRPALASEMAALNNQYPQIHNYGGNSGPTIGMSMIALGTWNQVCQYWPWINGMNGTFDDQVLSFYGNGSGLLIYPNSWVFPVVKM